MSERIEKALERGLRLAKSPIPGELIVDLAVPLLYESDLVGHLRFNCRWRRGREREFHELYRFVAQRMNEARAVLARALNELNEEVERARASISTLKMKSSLRAAFCDAVVWHLAETFRTDREPDPDVGRSRRFLAAAQSLGIPVVLCRQAFDEIRTFSEDLAYLRRDLPPVVLVSLWVTCKRPFIQQVDCQDDSLQDLFLEDRSFMRMLAVLVDHSYSGSFRTYEHLDTFWHRRNKDGTFVVIPPAYVSGPSGSEEPLNLEIESAGRSRVVTLRAGKREARLTWSRARIPRPISYEAVPRGYTRGFFGDGNLQSDAAGIAHEDRDGSTPRKLAGREGDLPSLLTRLDDILQFHAAISPRASFGWHLRRLEPRYQGSSGSSWVLLVDRSPSSRPRCGGRSRPRGARGATTTRSSSAGSSSSRSTTCPSGSPYGATSGPCPGTMRPERPGTGSTPSSRSSSASRWSSPASSVRSPRRSAVGTAAV